MPQDKWTASLLYRETMGQDSVIAIANYMNNKIKLVRNKKDTPPEGTDICIRWGCTGNVPNKRVFNRAKSIHKVFDKPTFRKTLFEAGLAPKMYHWADLISDAPSPIIIRPAHHTQGQKAFVLQDYSLHQLKEVVKECGEGLYISEYIQKEREFRVFVVQGRVAFVMEKFPNKKSDVAWDFSEHSQWGNVKWGSWPISVVDKAVKATELAEIDFGGVDVITDKAGNSFVLEVNAAGGVYGNYMAKCVAKCFDYVLDNRNDKTIPVGTHDTKNKYLNYIHPAVADTAVY